MLILVMLCLFGTLASGVFAFNLTQYTQNDFVMKTERYELVEHNEAYLSQPVCKNFKFNRTHAAVNFSATWIVDITDPLIVTVQGYKFSSNEYRLFPIYFPYDACDVLKRNIFGVQNLYNCGKMFRCPIKKGYFSTCNWDLDYSQFPPHFPRGRYMFSVDVHKTGIRVIKGNWYVEIKDVPLPYLK